MNISIRNHFGMKANTKNFRFICSAVFRAEQTEKRRCKQKHVKKCNGCNPHHVGPSAQIFLTLSCHPSLSSIASGRSSRLHPVSAQSCCMSVLAGRPAFVRPCEGVHKSTSLISSSLLLQQCPACFGKWPYSCCFVGYCLHDLFNIAHIILV